MSESQAYVGIDVSKAELEVAVADEGWTVLERRIWDRDAC